MVVEKIDMLPSSSGKDARFSAGRRGFESRWQCHIHLPVAQLDEQRATNAKVCRFESCREGQAPVNSSTGAHRPMTIARWPIGQATDSESVQTGSIPVRAANLAPWRNRNAAVCKTAMSRGSTGRGFQHALVDQLDGQPSSKRPYAGSSPVERAIIRQLARG
jgi:hypothetical protein